MMKKVIIVLLCSVLLISAGGFLFRAQLWDLVVYVFTRDVFIDDDTDSFDPGLAVGERFPAISALYEGKEIRDVNRFSHRKGLIFIANRSADW